MKKRVFSAVLTAILLVTQITGFAHWADPYFAELYEKEIIFGDDGGFRGDDPLLRCEFAAMLNRAFSFVRIKNADMPDVHKTDWYYNDMKALSDAGIMNGDANGMLHPKYPITRAEASVMIQRTLKLTYDGKGIETDSEDIPEWAEEAVLALMSEGIVSGYPDGKFYGNKFLLRGEAAVLLKKAMDKLDFSEGDGSYGNPYIINDERQIEAIKKDLNASYKLECDLNFTDTEFPIIGSENTPFNGSFDGNGHRIVVSGVADGNNSLFKKVGNDGIIKNLYLICPESRIAIAATNDGEISMCANTTWKGEGRDYSKYFGGIAQVNNGEIKGCYNLSEVVSFENGYIAGGIAGVNNNLISDCFNGGSTGKNTGGIAGENKGIIENVYTLSGKIVRYGADGVKNFIEGSDASEKFVSDTFVKKDGISVPFGMKYLSNEDFYLYGGGDGSKTNPYIIKNGTHFENINKNPDENFVQMADIDISGAVKVFGGSFDGNGYCVNTLRIRANSNEPSAMFIENRGEIKNVSVKDGLVSGSSNVAGIVLSNYGTVYRSGFNGLVTGTSGGGICKSNLESGKVSQCFFMGRVATDRLAASIVCENYGTVTDVYSSAEVLGNTAGGIVNYNKGTLEKCYFSGTVNSDFGGIAYENYGRIQSAYTTSLSTVSLDEGASGFVATRNEEQFKQSALLMGFDFYFVWESDGEGYPTLKNVKKINRNYHQNLKEFAGGSGTVTDPYKIATPMQLAAVSLYPDSNFILLGDIDLNEYTALHPEFVVCESFSGSFDGNNKTIRGFNVNYDNAALFKENTGVIRNLGVENSSLKGKNCAAVTLCNKGIVQNCYSDITLKNGGAGLVYNNEGTIFRSWSAGSIRGDIGSGISALNNGEITECYSVSDIYSDEGIGISPDGTVSECWFGGVLYGEKINPMPKSADETCFFLDFYGLDDKLGVTIFEDISKCYDENPWMWKEGMPVLQKMKAPDITGFRNAGDGSIDNPYIITKAEQLKFLGMYNDSHFVLDKNTDAEGMELLNISKFYGTLDGNGKRIFNFSVNSENGGIISELYGKVKNLTVSDFSVEGRDITGGIVAINNGTVENVTADNGRIGTDGSVAGGVVGLNKGSGLITNCLNRSDVFSSAISGGVCGDNQGTIVLSANHGGIVTTSDSEDAMSGGVAGKTVGLIDKCYNNGKILSYSESGESIAGGVSGSANGSILNCYNTGEITAKAKQSALSGGIIGDSDKFIEISNAYNTGFTNATANRIYQGSAVARVKNGKLNGFVYEHTLMFPIGEGELEESRVFAHPEDMLIREIGFVGFDFENVWSFSYDKHYFFPQLLGNKQDERVFPENQSEFAGGDGSLENPYKIITPEQLNNVRKHLGSTFMLIGDIDMTSFCRTNEFLPIGDMVFSFFGLFIGNNYTISGLHFSGEDFGLFRENHGEIYNLFFENASGSGSGGTIAKSNTGLIYNCANTGGEQAVSDNVNLNRGGLVGVNKSTGMIISSYNSGNLEFDGKNVQTGGIAHANYGIISGSFNSGRIMTNAETLSVAGGIAASNFGIISDCYSSDVALSQSTVTGDSFSGGLVGNNAGTVVNCYYSGETEPVSKLSGSVAATNSGRVVNCYYSGSHGIGRNVGQYADVVGVTSAELMQRQTFKDFDFENMWIMDSSFKYKCPQFIEIAHRD